MFKVICLSTILFISIGISRAQNAILARLLTAPYIDGTIDRGEWDDADSILLRSTGNNKDVTIKVMRSDTALYIAFLNNLAVSGNPNFPEVYIDMDMNGGTAWDANDHWFHVSATDCYSKGKPNDYNDCQKEPVDWSARRNWGMSAPDPDNVEIEIPFSKLNLDLNSVDSIGISFGLTNTFSRWDVWPSGATYQNPSGWGILVLKESQPNSIEERSKRKSNVYPNPSRGLININFIGGAMVINSRGELLREENLEEGQVLDLSDLAEGIYFLKLSNGEHHKIVIQN